MTLGAVFGRHLIRYAAGQRGSLELMIVFVVFILDGVFLALKYRPPHLILLNQKKMHTSAQLPVRLAVLVR